MAEPARRGWSSPRSAFFFLSVVTAASGCVREYHPDVHPEAHYTYVQNISYPTTVVQMVPATRPPARSASDARRAAEPRALFALPPPSPLVRYFSGP
jgi:hypothetical protein